MNHYLIQRSEPALPPRRALRHMPKAAALGRIWSIGQLTPGIPTSTLQGIDLVISLDERTLMYVGVQNAAALRWMLRINDFLRELKEVCENEYVRGDWDGYHARPISKAALADAERFIRMLPDFMGLPDFSPMPDGDVGLEWYGGEKRAFHVTFHGDRTVEYIGAFGEGDKVAGREALGDNIPESVLHYIGRIVASAA